MEIFNNQLSKKEIGERLNDPPIITDNQTGYLWKTTKPFGLSNLNRTFTDDQGKNIYQNVYSVVLYHEQNSFVF